MLHIEILMQDAQVIVCRKPAGVAAQGESAEAMPALLCAQCGGAVFPVHRLDQAVSGLMVYARTGEAAARLSAAMQAGTVQKEYLAVLSGVPDAEEADLEDLLFYDRARGKSFVCRRKRAGVKAARLHYTLCAQAADGARTRALVRVQLYTGRTHQIRVQFASRKLPLLGDGKYGGGDNRCAVALFSAGLRFPHPKSGQMLRFEAAPPQTFPWTLFF